MYAMFIFSAYALPSLLLMGATLYDYRLYSASGIAFMLISALSVFQISPIIGGIGLCSGASIVLLDVIYDIKHWHNKNKIIKFNMPIFLKNLKKEP